MATPLWWPEGAQYPSQLLNSDEQCPWAQWSDEQLERYAWRLLWHFRQSADGVGASHKADSTCAAKFHYWRDERHKVLTISFRECARTRNVTNSFWPSTADFGPGAGHKAHGGFLQEYLGLQQGLKEFMDTFDSCDSSDWLILLTGWSLGGAMAILCAVDLFSTLQAVCERTCKSLVTFGAPRAVSFELACWLNGCSFKHNLRVQADGDPANYYPKRMNGTFWHHGRLTKVKYINGSWHVAERARRDADDDEVGDLHGISEMIHYPFRIFNPVSPVVSGVMGFVLDIPFNAQNVFTHFTSYNQAYGFSSHKDLLDFEKLPMSPSRRGKGAPKAAAATDLRPTRSAEAASLEIEYHSTWIE